MGIILFCGYQPLHFPLDLGVAMILHVCTQRTRYSSFLSLPYLNTAKMPFSSLSEKNRGGLWELRFQDYDTLLYRQEGQPTPIPPTLNGQCNGIVPCCNFSPWWFIRFAATDETYGFNGDLKIRSQLCAQSPYACCTFGSLPGETCYWYGLQLELTLTAFGAKSEITDAWLCAKLRICSHWQERDIWSQSAM